MKKRKAREWWASVSPGQILMPVLWADQIASWDEKYHAIRDERDALREKLAAEQELRRKISLDNIEANNKLAAAEKERDAWESWASDEFINSPAHAKKLLDWARECAKARFDRIRELEERVSGMSVLLERLYEVLSYEMGRETPALINLAYWRKQIKRELSTAVDNHVARDERQQKNDGTHA